MEKWTAKRRQLRRLPLANHRKSSAVIVGLLLIGRLAAAADSPVVHIHNFGQVDGRVWRGAQPTLEALHELKEAGINVVLDLREHSVSEEKLVVENLGMQYKNFPLSAIAAPHQADVEAVLALLLRDPGSKIFVHCWRGKDRTGTIVACYRIQQYGWDNRRALEEAKSYGMSRLERAMQSYIMHFNALTLPALLPAGN